MKIEYGFENNHDKERNSKVYKSDKLIQQARYSLSITEQRFVLYAISKIKPEDDASMWYELSLKEFQHICGTDANESYNHIKSWIKTLSDRSWWLLQPDGYETLVRWFSTIKMRPDSSVILIKFHDEMFPYIFQLAEHMRISGDRYTSYMYRYVLPMRSTYSVRVYELLKSYHKNNSKWRFDVDKLKHLLDCDNYDRFADFRRFVLEPAVKEINKYTDIKVSYEAIKAGRKIAVVVFYIDEKTIPELSESHKAELTELDGNVHWWDMKAVQDD